MSELDEQIDKALEELVFCGRDNIGVTDEAVLARKAIKALIANQVREAKIDELERLELRLSKSTQYGIPVVDLQSAIDDRIKELGDDK